jgi:hypothetical protein
VVREVYDGVCVRRKHLMSDMRVDPIVLNQQAKL